MIKYDLTFYDAIKEMFENGKWIKGEQFATRVYLKVNSKGDVVMVDVNKFSTETPFPLYKGMKDQKYRIVEFATVKNLSE